MADEPRWAWVGEAAERYKQKETGAIRGLISQGHGTVQRFREQREEAIATADRISSTASAHLQMSLDRAWEAAWRVTDAYPMPVVGAATLAFVGVVGWAPRRTFLFGAGAAFALRRSIAMQHGEQLAEASGTLSQLCRNAMLKSTRRCCDTHTCLSCRRGAIEAGAPSPTGRKRAESAGLLDPTK